MRGSKCKLQEEGLLSTQNSGTRRNKRRNEWLGRMNDCFFTLQCLLPVLPPRPLSPGKSPHWKALQGVVSHVSYVPGGQSPSTFPGCEMVRTGIIIPWFLKKKTDLVQGHKVMKAWKAVLQLQILLFFLLWQVQTYTQKMVIAQQKPTSFSATTQQALFLWFRNICSFNPNGKCMWVSPSIIPFDR